MATPHPNTASEATPLPVVRTVDEVRAQVRAWRAAGQRIAFVPTMGNLHAGHYSLVTLARQHADKVVSSVFVNPTQFGPNEDFTRYPRTPEADTTGLEQAGCDVLWLPTVESMYPFGVELAANVHVPGVSALLEGAHRPLGILRREVPALLDLGIFRETELCHC